MYLFYKALTSKEISNYLKKHLSGVAPTTSNLLLHMKKITHSEHKKLIENDFHSLAILSHDIDFLKFFKEEFEQAHTLTRVFCFSKIELLENWLINNRADKLLIDYALSTTVFDSGLVYLKYFLKKIVKIKCSPLSSNTIATISPHQKMSASKRGIPFTHLTLTSSKNL